MRGFIRNHVCPKKSLNSTSDHPRLIIKLFIDPVPLLTTIWREEQGIKDHSKNYGLLHSCFLSSALTSHSIDLYRCYHSH